MMKNPHCHAGGLTPQNNLLVSLFMVSKKIWYFLIFGLQQRNDDTQVALQPEPKSDNHTKVCHNPFCRVLQILTAKHRVQDSPFNPFQC